MEIGHWPQPGPKPGSIEHPSFGVSANVTGVVGLRRDSSSGRWPNSVCRGLMMRRQFPASAAPWLGRCRHRTLATPLLQLAVSLSTIGEWPFRRFRRQRREGRDISGYRPAARARSGGADGGRDGCRQPRPGTGAGRNRAAREFQNIGLAMRRRPPWVSRTAVRPYCSQRPCILRSHSESPPTRWRSTRPVTLFGSSSLVAIRRRPATVPLRILRHSIRWCKKKKKKNDVPSWAPSTLLFC